MIGDSVHDLVAGKAANMISIGVLTGIATADELTNYADIILNNIGEIPNLLHNKNFN
jgi:phosphoglycolate phosphatase